jgi:hypothetical protein
MIFLPQRRGLLTGLILLGLFTPAGHNAYARDGGFSAGAHGGLVFQGHTET